jgi:uncharacterized protein (DUF427 family)
MSDGHRVTITPTDLHVVVSIGGEQVADSDRPVVLEETGSTTRYYLPRQDVRTDLLQPTSRASTCPYKGQASYWSVRIGDEVHDDVVWSYESPIPAAAGIAGLLCFYNERVDLTVDAVAPATPESSTGR